jgi:hypothetical protein
MPFRSSPVDGRRPLPCEGRDDKLYHKGHGEETKGTGNNIYRRGLPAAGWRGKRSENPEGTEKLTRAALKT